MKGKMLAKRQAGIRHIRSPGKGLLGEEQGTSHVRMPLGGIYLFASPLPLKTQLAVSSARLAVMCHGVESWGEVTCVVAGSFPFLAIWSAYKECGKPEEFGGKRPVGRNETGKGLHLVSLEETHIKHIAAGEGYGVFNLCIFRISLGWFARNSGCFPSWLSKLI